MAEKRLKAIGLYTHPNPLTLPEGALIQATNVIIRRDNIIEPTRGVSKYATETADRIFSYRGTLLIRTTANAIKYDNGSGTFTAVSGTYSHPDSSTAKMRGVEALQNFYFTTSGGVYQMDSTSATPAISGALFSPGVDRDLREATSTAGNMSLTSNVVTVNTSAAHGFYVGQVVTLTSATEGAQYVAGNYTVATVPSSTSFTYAMTAADDAGNANTHTFRPAQLVTAGGFLSDGNQVAYRIVFNSPDSNNTEKPGPVSGRIIIANASGTPGWVTTEAKNTVLRVLIPSSATTTTRVRVYRSKQTSTSVEPDDELGLVWEALLKQGEITAGYVDVTDIVPDAMRGDTIYTAPSQEGIGNTNSAPPLARDIALLRDTMFYAYTTQPHRFVISLLGVGAPDGVQNSDVFYVGSDSYTFTTSTPTTATQVYIDTAGSASQDIRNTALNFVAAVNRNTGGSYWATYISGPDDAPGKILFEAKTLGGSAFGVKLLPGGASGGKRTAWSPLPNTSQTFTLSRTSNVVTATTTSGYHNFLVGEQITHGGESGFAAGPHVILSTTGTTFTYAETGTNGAAGSSKDCVLYRQASSSADVSPNRVYESKPGQLEAVPLLSYEDLGSKDAEILRIASLRDSVFAFKEDGLYRKAYGGSWQLFDPTVILLAPDSVAALGNQLYALTTQGVVAITDTGVEIVSGPIHHSLAQLFNTDLSDVKNRSFGVAYESEHIYELRTISGSSDTICMQGWLYYTPSGAWTKDNLVAHHALVSPADDKRYHVGSSSIGKERKTFGSADYAGYDLSLTVTTNHQTEPATATFSSVAGVQIGDIINQGGVYGRVTAINGSKLTFASEDSNLITEFWSAGAATCYTSTAATVQWAPVTFGAPDEAKHFQDVKIIFGNAFMAAPTVSTQTELVNSASASVDMLTLAAQWTDASASWDGTERPYVLVTPVTQEHRRAAQLRVTYQLTAARTHWTIQGMSVTAAGQTPKVSR